MLTKRYTPLVSELCVTVTFVSEFTSDTVAFGTAAPFESRIVPCTLEENCAKLGAAMSSTQNANTLENLRIAVVSRIGCRDAPCSHIVLVSYDGDHSIVRILLETYSRLVT